MSKDTDTYGKTDRPRLTLIVGGPLVICPLFVLIAMGRSEATPGQRSAVLLLEAILVSAHLFVFLRLVQ